MSAPLRITPHPGPQEDFLKCGADVVFFGGGAGPGKTFASLLDSVRWASSVKGFTGVIFRRTFPEITNPGGLWDESLGLYLHARGIPNRSAMRWSWQGKGWIKFSHMQHETDVHAWQGSQLAGIYFDELTHFTEGQFFYMLSRNRSSCGVRPYVRATMNPDPDSWVRNFIDWWIDDEGFPIKERSGVIRYFGRINGVIHWADDPKDLELLGIMPKSFTFIPALLSDNPTLMQNDPAYVANLQALVSHERDRLLKGNWNARPKAGSYFKREWFPMVDEDALPIMEADAWYWDRASTEPNENNPDPDWTAGVRMSRDANGRFYVRNVVRFRKSPEYVQRMIRNCAESTPDADICLSQDPGQAGVVDVQALVRHLAGFAVRVIPEQAAKEVRARPVSSASELGSITVVRGRWNSEFFGELEGFPFPKNKGHDDQVDAYSGVYNYLARGMPGIRNT